jgi:hypothetical protein
VCLCPPFTRITMRTLVDVYITMDICVCFPISDFQVAHQLLRNVELRLCHRKPSQSPSSELPEIGCSYICVA